MEFQVTTSLKKILAMKARKKVVQGATSSGKTYNIIPIIYDRCLQSRIKATVVAETLPAVKEGCVDIFKSFMMDEGRWNDSQWNESSLIWTCKNRSKLQFKSFDSVGKAKASGKRDILFINEANHIAYEIADALMIRTKEIWMDFNADATFWAHDKVLTEPNSEFLKLTYLDNEAIPAETLEDLLIRKAKAEAEDARGHRGYNWNWWQVYGLGEIGRLQGAVWSNWEHIEEIPKEARLICYGLDFGFSNSYTAVVAVYKMDNRYYFDEIMYDRGKVNSEIAEIIKKHPTFNNDVLIYCDYAEPKSIEELKRAGLRATPCESKKDIRTFVIDKLNHETFYVTTRSANIIDNLNNYIWDTDRNGNPLNTPKKANDHCPDAMIYAVGSEGKYDGNY